MKSRRKSALNLMTVVVLLILVFDILPVHAAGNVSTLSWNVSVKSGTPSGSFRLSNVTGLKGRQEKAFKL